MNLRTLRASFVLFFLILSFVNCASSFQSDLENARFQLDQGNYTSAISYATSALQNNPNSADAARLLANAYFGRSGLDYLDLASAMTDLQNSDEETNLRMIADALPESADMDDVRSAIETLEALDNVDDSSFDDNEDLADAVFDLATMQAIEHFALGVYQSSYFTTFDPTQIEEATVAMVQDDLVDFDNRLMAVGVDEDFIEEVRQTFCILEPLSADEGFTISEYRAFVGCQLSDSPDTFDTTAIDPDIANCDVMNAESQNDSVQACYSEDTSL